MRRYDSLVLQHIAQTVNITTICKEEAVIDWNYAD